MRALILHSGNLYGGVETALVSLVRASRDPAKDLDLAVALCFDDGRVAGELRETGVTVHTLGAARLSRPWQTWQARSRLRRLLDAQRFDLCITLSTWTHAIFAPVVRGRDLPLVAWAHDRWTGTRWLDRLAMRVPPDLVVANSRYTADAMPTVLPGVPLRIVHCPLASPAARQASRQAIRAELHTSKDAVVVVNVARMEPGKGHRVLIEALGRIPASAAWHCWIIGGAASRVNREYLAELQAAARAAGIGERVTFAGMRQDVDAVLAAADVFCHPNTVPETFGLVFVEALRAGLPVVGPASGGVLDIVTEECGRLVPPGDADGLAAVLCGLIGSTELRRALGARGPARASALCDPDARASDFARALSSVLPSGRHAGGAASPALSSAVVRG